MKTEIGEYIVGAYLQLEEKCDLVCYNEKPKREGLKGLGELDVIGLRFSDSTVFICEVVTHLGGLNYDNRRITSFEKILNKHKMQRKYAGQHFSKFEKRFQLWSPRIRAGLLNELIKIEGLEIIANDEYTKRIDGLNNLAEKNTKDYSNPFFRTLQIFKHLKR